MGADFYNLELRMETIVPPLLAISPTCNKSCLKLDEVVAAACNQSVIMPGIIEVVYCTEFDANTCPAEHMYVGDIADGTFVVSKFFKGVQDALRTVLTEGVEVDEALVEQARNFGNNLTEAINNYGVRQLGRVDLNE